MRFDHRHDHDHHHRRDDDVLLFEYVVLNRIVMYLTIITHGNRISPDLMPDGQINYTARNNSSKTIRDHDKIVIWCPIVLD